MERLVSVLTFLSAMGVGLIGGLFFAFSTFIMVAFGRVAPAVGIMAMRSINVAILNPLFFTVFFGTAVCCLILGIVAVVGWQTTGAAYLLIGSLSYLLGVIAVTMMFNVPLNDALAASDLESVDGVGFWRRYLSVWTLWNHVRTVACVVAMASFISALN
jgi:uncharacterized membrane protein